MHKIVSYYFLLIISICTFNYIVVNSYSDSLKGKTIYIDPGHGGVDNGAHYNDIKEDELNLKICYELKSKLENMGANVLMTRYDDYDLSANNIKYRKKNDLYNRAYLIDKSESDMYLSIHLNYINSTKWMGAQVFYDDINSNNKKLASIIQKNINTKRDSMLIKDRYMYRQIKTTGVLIELGFLSNEFDRNTLKSSKKRQKLIDNIVNGIIEYYK